MNCHRAQTELLAARDTPSGAAGSRALVEHLQGCPACRTLQQQLVAATSAWRETEAQVAVPDAQQEWHAVRRRIRQSEPVTNRPAWWVRSLQLAAPLTAAAAIALVIWSGRAPSPDPPIRGSTAELAANDDPWTEFADHFASAAKVEYVETENEDASPFVYVDDESGWLIVWASAPPAEASI